MITKKDITKQLAVAGNLMNTVGGGMVQVRSKFNKLENHYKVSFNIPGISREHLNVEINNNKILVFHRIQSNNNEMPYLITFFDIPNDVDHQNISASFKHNDLEMILPFNELSNGYRRKIDIFN